MTSTLAERIECAALRRLVVPADEAARRVKAGDVLAVSGFTKAGEPKEFMPALARHLATLGPDAKITLYSGASLSEEVEAPLAPYIARRGPYMSSTASRRLIHAGKMDYTDVHLSHFARGVMYGFYGDIDLAVIEVSRVRPDGSVVLSASVGVSPEALARAKAVVLEVNTAIPDFTGMHDIVLPAAPPTIGWPVPVTGVRDRVGAPYVRLDPSQVLAVVEPPRPVVPLVPPAPSGPFRDPAPNPHRPHIDRNNPFQ